MAAEEDKKVNRREKGFKSDGSGRKAHDITKSADDGQFPVESERHRTTVGHDSAAQK